MFNVINGKSNVEVVEKAKIGHKFDFIYLALLTMDKAVLQKSRYKFEIYKFNHYLDSKVRNESKIHKTVALSYGLSS